ncbi:hypothetical protein ACFPRL_24210 [Pseudoclavibacter helvolus]
MSSGEGREGRLSWGSPAEHGRRPPSAAPLRSIIGRSGDAPGAGLWRSRPRTYAGRHFAR